VQRRGIIIFEIQAILFSSTACRSFRGISRSVFSKFPLLAGYQRPDLIQLSHKPIIAAETIVEASGASTRGGIQVNESAFADLLFTRKAPRSSRHPICLDSLCNMFAPVNEGRRIPNRPEKPLSLLVSNRFRALPLSGDQCF
jgi:hypothetical protein